MRVLVSQLSQPMGSRLTDDCSFFLLIFQFKWHLMIVRFLTMDLARTSLEMLFFGHFIFFLGIAYT